MDFESLISVNRFILSDLILQSVLGIFFLWVLYSWRKKKQPGLTFEEEEEIIRNWNPEPLISASEPPIDRNPANYPLITSKIGAITQVNGKDCVNFASHNYYNFASNSFVEKKVLDCLHKYGIGTCGPRGFYGTLDIHLNLEQKLAGFMGMEEAALYSYGFSAISSAIAAYAKKNDIIFADEKVNFRIQKGLDASRSSVVYFKHNNMEDLKEKLEEQRQKDLKNPRKAKKIRRFIVIEGIYMYTANICKLPETVALATEHKARLFIDESISLFTLGKRGRGVTDYFNVPTTEVDLIMGTMEFALGSGGGFAVGTSYVIEQQRLSGLGYCFSASLPPILTEAGMTAIKLIEEDPSLKEELTNKCKYLDQSLKGSLDDCFIINGHEESPIKHLHLKNSYDRSMEEDILRSIVTFFIKLVGASIQNHDRIVAIDAPKTPKNTIEFPEIWRHLLFLCKCLTNNTIVSMPTYLDKEVCMPRPSILVTVNLVLTHKQIDDLAFILKEACQRALKDNGINSNRRKSIVVHSPQKPGGTPHR